MRDPVIGCSWQCLRQTGTSQTVYLIGRRSPAVQPRTSMFALYRLSLFSVRKTSLTTNSLTWPCPKCNQGCEQYFLTKMRASAISGMYAHTDRARKGWHAVSLKQITLRRVRRRNGGRA